MTEKATFGGGCFWCIEAAYKELEGVTSVTSGYAGGDKPDPSYREVCRGSTGHTEVVQVEYHPETVTYPDLLELFFTIHDPTQLNRQGPDVGSQYRSIVLYHDEEQRQYTEEYVEQLEAEQAFNNSVVTDIEPIKEFYEAGEKHQDYYEKNPADGYCRTYVEPKVQKVRENFETESSVAR
ncbi:peptide-methionine (S)-S-oxide reductase MsrA [Halosegnis sp.]|uniref:peptide-methionine (S)-S-oxide reductase MsrA n=1 Tax=Halosegnis sp. TaxID=2864959 RepID=UPI0035D47FFC